MFKRRGKTLQRMNRTKYREGSRNSRKKHIEIWKDEQKCFFFRASAVEVPNDATFQNKDVGLIIEDLKVDERVQTKSCSCRRVDYLEWKSWMGYMGIGWVLEL